MSGTLPGTPTMRADPAGGYAWGLFAKAEALRQGVLATLEAKALRLSATRNALHTGKEADSLCR